MRVYLPFQFSEETIIETVKWIYAGFNNQIHQNDEYKYFFKISKMTIDIALDIETNDPNFNSKEVSKLAEFIIKPKLEVNENSKFIPYSKIKSGEYVYVKHPKCIKEKELEDDRLGEDPEVILVNILERETRFEKNASKREKMQYIVRTWSEKNRIL